MVASLNGIIFEQFYGDNSGGAEFDTDRDGTTTQEDEFVSFINTSGVPVDLSGWQIWSDMSGSGAPDGPQDGLYHTFPAGTVLSPGERIYIVNEITGTPAFNMQEASRGGTESGPGGTNTNFLSEGDGNNSRSESVALVNPATGQYIILNFTAIQPSIIPGLSGFPGTTKVGESNAAADSGVEDQNAGFSYQYNSTTGRYEYAPVEVVCYAAGTMIETPDGPRPVESLQPGDLVLTLDHGAMPIRWVRSSDHALEEVEVDEKPVLIAAGALGSGVPAQDLIVSPQHRMLVGGVGQLQSHFKTEAFAPAKSLTSLRGIRHMKGQSHITWVHFACDRHEIVTANGCLSESLLLGPMAVKGLTLSERLTLTAIFGPTPSPDAALNGAPARTCLKVGEVHRLLAEYSKTKSKSAETEIHNWDRDVALEKHAVERSHDARSWAQSIALASRVAVGSSRHSPVEGKATFVPRS